ncbi:MAG: hypothetical protein WA793_00870, partial [Sphingorhabdus sp.]|uniref:hypothetical protein n=1 Tax=Sphingorhabdus sp. TaxID=1902408 RepID=UPI003C8D8BBF
LILPTGVTKSKFNAATNKAYNPGEAIGDLSPTMAQPPKKNKCGVFGQILLAVIAIAVTYFSAGTLTGALGPVLGGAAAGAAGSVVSQVVGVATGIQEKFSWKSVGLAAIGGAVGGGLKELGRLGDLGKLGSFSKVGSFIGGTGFASTVTRAVTSSAITQGIGVATGLQDKFSWAGVAAAGIGAAVGYGMGKLLGATSLTNEYDSHGDLVQAGDTSFSNHMANLGKSASSMIANAATRSLIEGSDFGDNVLAALPDVIAQTIGDMLINGINSGRNDDGTGRRTISESMSSSALEHENIGMLGDIPVFEGQSIELFLDTEFTFSEDVTFEDVEFGEGYYSPSEANIAALDGKDGVLAARDGITPNASAGLIRGTDGEIDLSLITDVDALRLQEAASLFDIPDVFTVLGHGPELSMRTGEREYQPLSRRQRWNLISGNRGDRPVMLLSCRTGSERAEWVQKLSDDLGGVPVMAATSQTWWSRDGDVVRARAYWRESGPRGPRTGDRMNLNDPGEFRIFGGDITSFGFRALPRGYQIREIQVNSRANWVRIIAYDSRGRQEVRQRGW